VLAGRRESGPTPSTGSSVGGVLDNVKVGDIVRYKGTYGQRTGEVLEIPDDRLLVIRRQAPASDPWASRDGGVRPILRERVIEVLSR
jgi:hypothetical protein